MIGWILSCQASGLNWSLCRRGCCASFRPPFEPIDSWCHDRLYEYLDFKKLKRDFKTKFVCVDIDTNELYAYEKKGHSDLAFRNHMNKNHPNDVCLNFLELDLAFKFFNGATS